jgi:SSS family solute:Na+ symporter/sodium/pantothenate symporter
MAGTIAGMVTGAGSVLCLYVCGFLGIGGDPLIGPVTSFRPYYLLGLDPILWGLAGSLVAGVLVSLVTPPPDPGIVSAMFDARPDPVRLADLRADSIDSHLTGED